MNGTSVDAPVCGTIAGGTRHRHHEACSNKLEDEPSRQPQQRRGVIEGHAHAPLLFQRQHSGAAHKASMPQRPARSINVGALVALHQLMQGSCGTDGVENNVSGAGGDDTMTQ